MGRSDAHVANALRVEQEHGLDAAIATLSSLAPLDFAHAVRHLADAYRRDGALDKAARCSDEALRVYREHPEAPPLDLANALRSAALIHEKTAIDLWREAAQLYERAGVQTGAEEAARRLAER